MADLHREKVTQLARALQHEETRTEAAEALLVDAIVLTRQRDTLEIERLGNLAAPTYQQLQSALRQSPVVWLDDTG